MSLQAPTSTPRAMPVETVFVESPVVACDGGANSSGGALGHPRVYLNMGDKHEIDCPYCGRHYVLSGDAHRHGH